jgi:hypothetical protein
MRTALRGIVTLTLLASMLVVQPVDGQDREPEVRPALASGTINLVLANKNGFVIAADSRMSSETAFYCEPDGKRQLYCDNSQKLFRTGPTSAMVIAGFAVGHKNSPLDLAIASVLRRRFGSAGLPGDRGTPYAASDWAEHALRQALIGVAALYNPAKIPAQNLSLTTIFAGFDKNGAPVLRRLLFTETWSLTGPLHVMAPEYQVISAEKKITKFFPVTAGITCVADAVLAGIYKSNDPVIQGYNQKLRNKLLDDLSLQEMRALAQVILRETRNFTPLVGGEDQIGEFSVNGDVRWNLPAVLPSQTQLSPSFMLWKGLFCTNSQPQCTADGRDGLTYFQDFQHSLDEPTTKFFLASRFKDIAVALDNNYFVSSHFEGVTLKWRGGTLPFMHANTFDQCAIELPEGKDLPPDSELNGQCRLIRKPEVVVDPSTVGAPAKMQTSGCVTNNPDGSVSVRAGGSCGSTAGIFGPILQP